MTVIMLQPEYTCIHCTHCRRWHCCWKL